MVPVLMDDFVRTLLRDRQVEIDSSVLVSDNARVFADAVPKAVSFDHRNQEKQPIRLENRWGGPAADNSNGGHTAHRRDRWGSAPVSDACSCPPMPRRNMSPYRKQSEFRPSSSSPGSIARSLLLQSLSDHFPDLHYCSDEEYLSDDDHIDWSIFRKKDNHHSLHSQHYSPRSPEQPPILDGGGDDNVLALEMSPGLSPFEDEDDLSMSTVGSD